MASLLGEIRRRKIFQVAAAYLVVAWLLVQVITAIEEPLRLPDWFDTAVIVLLGIGFPVTMVMSWAFNLTSEGLVRDEGGATPGASGGRSLEHVLIGLLVVAVGWLLYQNLRTPNEATTAAAVPAVEPAPDEGADDLEAARSRLPNSIAILPCDNLSPNPDNDYFAASIHEEMLNQLVKIRALNVIARTSVLQYADAKRPITDIAAELNVGSIMECSVSYAENRVAVNAQLIDGITGVHIWSDRYTDELANVFEIQADIAMNIANELEAEFSATEQTRLSKVPTESSEATALYLRALDPPSDPTATSQDRAVIADQYLARAIEIDPNFALAYAYRAQLFANRGRGTVGVDPEWERRVRDAAEQALAIDPNLASAHAAIAAIDHANWRRADAERAYRRAYDLNPKDPSVLAAYATFKRDTGDYAESIRLFTQLAEIDPNADRNQLGITYFYARSYEQALEIAEERARRSPADGGSHMRIGFIEIARGNDARGLQELAVALQLPIAGSSAFWRTIQIALAYKYAGAHSEVERLLAPALREENPITIGGAERVGVYIALEQYDRAMQELQAVLQAANPTREPFALLGQIKANPFADPALETPQWKALLGRIGDL